jgi:hypothetical protein
MREAIYREKDKLINLDVLIPCIENEKGFVREQISIKESQKVYSLVEQVAERIGLKYYKDFRLYL